ncbi:hypothetical protein EQG49_04170 [Periweissella cryptocerci]|uniref:Gram-positive cocci surface proteins LPxTG domain-containing protein n=1 Tax=Periweissella cryptocerci TaxID=2506420 RepID=A0A4P6YSV7_9LACO|nr:leucine-rich repeat protein [Periweissella cryptocerci]QBO35713.1 hypothetical protein EQG49_04170 [Periweissella cryptocerci]
MRKDNKRINKINGNGLPKRGKQLMYAGLTTMTLVGGLGATPLVLADTAAKTDSVASKQVKTDKKRVKAITTQAITAANKNAKTAAKKATRNGIAHTFVRSDFIIEQIKGRPTLVDFNYDNFDPDDNWDGNLTFSADFNDIQAIGDGAFQNIDALTNADLKTLPNLEILGKAVFSSSENLLNVDFDNLQKLTTIGSYAFSDTGIKSLNLINLDSFQIIGGDSFYNCPNLAEVNLINLKSLVVVGEDLFENVPSLATVNFINLPLLETLGGEWLDGNIIKTLKLIDLPNLKEWAAGFAWLPYAETIYVSNFSDDFGEDLQFFEDMNPGGVVIPVTADDIDLATMFVNQINSDCNFRTQATKWAIGGAVEYKYVDQNNNEIITDANGDAVVPYTSTGRVGDSYGAKLPQIAGYSAGQLIAGTANGTLTMGQQQVVFQFRSATPTFTVYTVDGDDNELAAPQEFSGFIGDYLTLRPYLIDGYNLKGLFGSVTDMTRAVGDYTWEQLDNKIIGSAIDYQDNAGRSYKFVYEETTPVVDTPVVTTPTTPAVPDPIPNVVPGTNIDTGANTATDKTPAKTTSTKKPVKAPTSLPVSGGAVKSTPKATPTATRTVTTTTTTTTNDDGILPKSGIVKNVVLPILGGTLLVGLVGIAMFGKKRKA